MTTARFFEAHTDKRVYICSFVCLDHTGYAKQGADIACAAVSSAVMTVANLMTECFHLPVKVTADARTATVSIDLMGPDETGNAERLYRGLALQLREIEKQFPGYFHIEFLEV